jgi:hypothetical protein
MKAMSGGRRQLVRQAASSLLVVLLVVPLLASAHRHAAQEMQDQHCAACVLVRHSPAVSTIAITTVTPAVCDRLAEPAPRLPDAERQQSPEAGRAPPSPASGLEA